MKIDFAGRYKSAFGVVPNRVSKRLEKDGFGEVMRNPSSGYELKSDVYFFDNKATFDEITLRNDDKEYFFGFKGFSEMEDGNYNTVFAAPPMLSFSRSRRTVITPIDHSDTEDIEVYSTNPYEIQMKGLLIDMENHNFPIDKLETINEIFEESVVWDVDSEILQALGIVSIWIKRISIGFIEGFEDTISYNMTVRAIKPIEFQLLEK